MHWKVEVDKVANEEVGRTFTRLDGEYSKCGTQECNMGNFLADAMVFSELLVMSSSDWSQAPIAITTAGSIRASVDSGNICLFFSIGKIFQVLIINGKRNS